MASIDYTVTKRPVTGGRLNTVQSYELKVISKFNRPTINAGRTHVMAMDRKSSQGTYLGDDESFVIDIVYDDADIPYVDEMLYSLFDFQEATLNGTDIPKLGAVRTFKLTGQSWATESVGCSGNQLTLNGTFFS